QIYSQLGWGAAERPNAPCPYSERLCRVDSIRNVIYLCSAARALDTFKTIYVRPCRHEHDLAAHYRSVVGQNKIIRRALDRCRKPAWYNEIDPVAANADEAAREAVDRHRNAAKLYGQLEASLQGPNT